MRHQLLPEGELFFGRIISIPPFPHFIAQIFPSFYVLLLGRILSGVSTSCLYSVFEVINPTSRKKRYCQNKKYDAIHFRAGMLRSTRLEDCPTKRSHRLLHWSGPDKNDIFPKSESSLISNFTGDDMQLLVGNICWIAF